MIGRHRNRHLFAADKWVAMATAQCDVGRFTVGWANSTDSHRVDPLFAQPADRGIGFYNLSDSFKPDLTGRSLDTVAWNDDCQHVPWSQQVQELLSCGSLAPAAATAAAKAIIYMCTTSILSLTSALSGIITSHHSKMSHAKYDSIWRRQIICFHCSCEQFITRIMTPKCDLIACGTQPNYCRLGGMILKKWGKNDHLLGDTFPCVLNTFSLRCHRHDIIGISVDRKMCHSLVRICRRIGVAF